MSSPKLPKTVTKSGEEERTVVSVGGTILPWDPLWQYVLGDKTDDEDDSSYDDSYDDRYGLNDKSFDDTIEGHSFDLGNESSFDTYGDTDDEEVSVVHNYFKNKSSSPNEEMRQLLANKRYEEILDALRLYDQVKEERDLRTEALFGNNSNNNQRIAALLGRGRSLSFQRRNNNNNNNSSGKGQQPQQLLPSASSRSFAKCQQQQTKSSSSSSLPINLVADLEREHPITQRIPSSLMRKKMQQQDHHSVASATTNPTSNKEIPKQKVSAITKASVPKLSSSSSSLSPTITSKPSSLSSISELVRTISRLPQQQQQHPQNTTITTTGNNLNKNVNIDVSNKNITLSKSTSSITNGGDGGFLRRNSRNSACKTKRDEIVNNNHNNNNINNNKSLREEKEKEEKDSHLWSTAGWQLDPDIFPPSLSSNFNGNRVNGEDDIRDDSDIVNQGTYKRNIMKGNKRKKNILRKLMCQSIHDKNNVDYEYNHNDRRLYNDEQSTNKNSVSTYAISEQTNDPW